MRNWQILTLFLCPKIALYFSSFLVKSMLCNVAKCCISLIVTQFLWCSLPFLKPYSSALFYLCFVLRGVYQSIWWWIGDNHVSRALKLQQHHSGSNLHLCHMLLLCSALIWHCTRLYIVQDSSGIVQHSSTVVQQSSGIVQPSSSTSNGLSFRKPHKANFTCASCIRISQC